MTLEIRVGPPQLTVHQGYTVMVSNPDGQIADLGQNGLFFLDTRLICVWTIFADGVPLEAVERRWIVWGCSPGLLREHEDLDGARDNP